MRHTHLALLLASLDTISPLDALACGNAMAEAGPDPRIVPMLTGLALGAALGALLLGIMVARCRKDRPWRITLVVLAALLGLCAGGALGGWSGIQWGKRNPPPPKLIRHARDGALAHFNNAQTPLDQRTFPGGTDYRFNNIDGPGTGPSCSSAPQGGSSQPSFTYFRQKRGDTSPVSPQTRALLTTLGWDKLLYEQTRYQYAYETGPGRGTSATATLTMLINLNPHTPECHTSTITLRVDPDSRVAVANKHTITHELE